MSEYFQEVAKQLQEEESRVKLLEMFDDPETDQWAFLYYNKNRQIGGLVKSEWIVASAMATFLEQHSIRLLEYKREENAKTDTPTE